MTHCNLHKHFYINRPGAPEYLCDMYSIEGTFQVLANHRISDHSDSVLRFNKRVLSEASGKMAKVCIDFKYIPSEKTE